MDGIYKALADPSRRRILALLRERDLTAGQLAEHFELARPTLSGHFGVLKRAGLIQGDRRGSTITYRLNVSVLEEALWALMSAFDVQAAPVTSAPATNPLCPSVPLANPGVPKTQS